MIGSSTLRKLTRFALPLSMLFLVLPGGTAVAQAPTQAQVQDAIDRGLAYLLEHQRDDGSIRNNDQHATAMTSLALMALASVGHMPADQTPEGQTMRRALEFVLRDSQVRSRVDGYFGQADGSRMYGHGIITLMLTEMLGQTGDDQMDQLVHERVDDAIEVILRSQQVNKPERHRGGWRYNTNSSDSDLSVTVWQLMALRSAAEAGIDVPSEAIDQAVAYLQRSYVDRDNNGSGGFRYMNESSRSPEYSTTAAGLLAMQVAGQYDAPQTRGAIQHLERNHAEDERNHRWWYYGTYYYAQGMHQAGPPYDAQARDITARMMLGRQQNDGSFRGQDSDRGTPIYSTSLAILSLSVQHHFLPIYQR